MHQDKGLTLAIRLTPKADRDSVDGFEDSDQGLIIKARVRAIPEKGKANTALIKLLSKWLDVPKSDIDLLSGGKSRIKKLAIAGDTSDLEGRLSGALQALKR